MSGAIAALLAGVGSTSLDTQTVTTGAAGTAPAQDRSRGYGIGVPFIGSISDGTSNIYGGAAINYLYWQEDAAVPSYYLAITGATNTGWTTLTIGSKVLNRTAATFASGSWTWTTADTITTQAFSTGGSSISCVFA